MLRREASPSCSMPLCPRRTSSKVKKYRPVFSRQQPAARRATQSGDENTPAPRGVVRRSADERYGVEDRSTWYRDTLLWDRWPVDVSFLNEKPAGYMGTCVPTAIGSSSTMERRCASGGANVQANALFQGKKEDVALQAKRIAALGYNLVRIHHHDSPWVRPNVFDPFIPTTQKLDDRSLDRIDWWVKCLKDEGIYVWMDLHVGRQFAKGDNVEGFAELARRQGSGRVSATSTRASKADAQVRRAVPLPNQPLHR